MKRSVAPGMTCLFFFLLRPCFTCIPGSPVSGPTRAVSGLTPSGVRGRHGGRQARGNPEEEGKLKQLFKNAFQLYNPGAADYATDIVDKRAPNHLPIADRPIFPTPGGGL